MGKIWANSGIMAAGFGTGYSAPYLADFGISEEEVKGIIATDKAREMILDVLLYEFMKGVMAFKEDELKHGWLH